MEYVGRFLREKVRRHNRSVYYCAEWISLTSRDSKAKGHNKYKRKNKQDMKRTWTTAWLFLTESQQNTLAQSISKSSSGEWHHVAQQFTDVSQQYDGGKGAGKSLAL
jgi:hypothetical protein